MADIKFHGVNNKFFVGVIEENDDSTCKDGKKLGRCQVRLLGIHSPSKIIDDGEGEGIPTDKLHWAYLLNSPTNSSMNGIGQSPTGLLKGSWVVVMSMDGNSCQDLWIMGSFGGIPSERLTPSEGFSDPSDIFPLDSHLGEEDTNRLARREKIEETIVKKKFDKRTKYQVDIPICLNEFALPEDKGEEPEVLEEGEEAGTRSIMGGSDGIDAGGDGREYNRINTKWSQPAEPYNATYPHNSVMETRFEDDDTGTNIELEDITSEPTEIEDVKRDNGHIVEFDSTPGEERIHEYHKSGTFREIDKDGTKVETIVKDNYKIIYGHNFIHIEGSTNVTVDGTSNVYILGDSNLQVDGNCTTLVKGNCDTRVNGNHELIVDGDYVIRVGGNMRTYVSQANELHVQDQYQIVVGANIDIDAVEDIDIDTSANIYLN
jgi:hypothetical protein